MQVSFNKNNNQVVIDFKTLKELQELFEKKYKNYIYRTQIEKSPISYNKEDKLIVLVKMQISKLFDWDWIDVGEEIGVYDYSEVNKKMDKYSVQTAVTRGTKRLLSRLVMQGITDADDIDEINMNTEREIALNERQKLINQLSEAVSNSQLTAKEVKHILNNYIGKESIDELDDLQLKNFIFQINSTVAERKDSEEKKDNHQAMIKITENKIEEVNEHKKELISSIAKLIKNTFMGEKDAKIIMKRYIQVETSKQMDLSQLKYYEQLLRETIEGREQADIKGRPNVIMKIKDYCKKYDIEVDKVIYQLNHADLLKFYARLVFQQREAA